MRGEQYRIGDLLLDSGTQQVTRGGAELPLTRLSFNLLLALARSAPEMLTVEELEQQVWPGLVVEPDTVAKRVRLLRAALTDDSHHPRYVAVVRGRGYRLLAHVEQLHGKRAAARRATGDETPERSVAQPRRRRSRGRALRAIAFSIVTFAVIAAIGILVNQAGRDDQTLTAAGHPTMTIAVLPLINASGVSEQDYLAAGITDELRYRLGQIPSLGVISRRSSDLLRNKTDDREALASRVDVDYLLDGTLSSSYGRIRVTIELVDAASDRIVLAQRYEHGPEDLLEIQDEIARSVADTLSLSFLEVNPAPWGQTTPEAHVLYLRGRNEFRKRSFESAEKAARLFDEALQIDPENARATAGRALSILWLATLGAEPARRARQRAADLARRAVSLDPQLAEAHAALGLSSESAEAREAAYRRALALSPSDADTYHWLCLTLGAQGRLHEAHEAAQRARALDPLNPLMIGQSAWTLSHLGRHEEARARLLAALTYIEDVRWIRNYLASLENAVGRPDRALEWYVPGPAESAPEAWPYVVALLEIGRLGEAEALLETDLARWPGNRWGAHKRAIAKWAARDFSAMETIMEQVLAEGPQDDDSPMHMDDRLSLWFAGIAKIYLGKYGQAAALMEDATSRDNLPLHEPRLTLFFWVDLAYAQLKTDDHASARQTLDEGIRLAARYERAGFRQAWLPFATGLLYAMDGRSQMAENQLEEAYQRGWRHVRVHDRSYVLEDFVAEPGSTQFLSRMAEDLDAMRKNTRAIARSGGIGVGPR